MPKKVMWEAYKSHKIYTKKPEMPPVTFVGGLWKIHAVLC